MLISHAATPELSLLELDTSSVIARIPLAPEAELEAGANGRHGYAFSPAHGVLRVVDPGQWLLSHIDHFHIVRGEHRLMDEQVALPNLSSLRVNDGWTVSLAASTGAAALFQERSITARSFAPTFVSLAPSSPGVALVAQAQLLASDGASLTQRSVLDPALDATRLASCTRARDAAANGERVYFACAEGVLRLTWVRAEERFAAQLLTTEAPVEAVRTTARFDGVLLRIGARTLGLLAEQAPLRLLELPSDIVALELRRQGGTALVLTVDGRAHELDLRSGSFSRTTSLPVTSRTRMVLGHAHAYLTDPTAAQVLVLRLRTMQLEPALLLAAPAHDLALLGVPNTYTDERE
ncbi:MAG: hypothetical protein ABW352_13430 [Polyangiales bacterium]